MVNEGVRKVGHWIYVTGLPRSGSTFVGKVLSLPRTVDYIHEPFNPSCGVAGLQQRYPYLRPGQEDDLAMVYHQAVQGLLTYQAKLKTGVYAADSPLKRMAKRLVGSRGGVYWRLARLNRWRQAAVIKDPTGFLLTTFLAEGYGMHPVIVVRHPASFVASWRRIGWWPDLNLLLEQPQLMEDYLADERALMVEARQDHLDTLAVFWRVGYKVLLREAEAHPGWHVVTHEGLSAAPLDGFADLYRRLGLPWSPRVRRRLQAMTGTGNPVEARGGRVQDFNRDSAALFEMRRGSLSRAERRRIFALTDPIASSLYAPESFALEE